MGRRRSAFGNDWKTSRMVGKALGINRESWDIWKRDGDRVYEWWTNMCDADG